MSKTKTNYSLKSLTDYHNLFQDVMDPETNKDISGLNTQDEKALAMLNALVCGEEMYGYEWKTEMANDFNEFLMKMLAKYPDIDNKIEWAD